MGKKSKNLIRIEYAAAWTALGLMGILPRSAAVWLGIWILKLVPFVMKGLRRTGMRNLEIAFPEKSVAERKKILSGTFENLGRVLGELSQVGKFTREKLAEIIDFNLDEESKTLYAINKAEGRGVLITTGHLGNWELLVLGCRLGITFGFVNHFTGTLLSLG